MWVNPKHPNPPRPSEPPTDEGCPLGAFPRGDGTDELRVTLKTYKGFPYISFRVWTRDDRDRFWPVPGKGVSVRMAEVEGVIEALRAAVEQDGRVEPYRLQPTRAGRAGSSRAGRATVRRPASAPFSEFEDDGGG